MEVGRPLESNARELYSPTTPALSTVSVNQVVPSDFTATSFGELNFLPSWRSTTVWRVPSFSRMLTRRPLCSQVTKRPWRSTVLPLALRLGFRNVLSPSLAVQRLSSSAGMSLKTR